MLKVVEQHNKIKLHIFYLNAYNCFAWPPTTTSLLRSRSLFQKDKTKNAVGNVNVHKVPNCRRCLLYTWLVEIMFATNQPAQVFGDHGIHKFTIFVYHFSSFPELRLARGRSSVKWKTNYASILIDFRYNRGSSFGC